MSNDGSNVAPSSLPQTNDTRSKGSHKRTSSTSTSITTNATSTHHRKPSYTLKSTSAYLTIPENFKSLDMIQQSPNEVVQLHPQLVDQYETSYDSPLPSSIPPKRRRYQRFFSFNSRSIVSNHTRNCFKSLSFSSSSSGRLPSFLRYRWLRFLLFIYAIFSVCVTFVHLFQWSFEQWP